MREGQTEARASISQVLAKPHAFGVGAVEGLRGEIIIDDGRCWTAEVVAKAGQPVALVRDGVQSLGATLLVVERPSDIVTLEQLGVYRGLYHVLMGRLSPLESVGVGDLSVAGLLERAADPQVKEIILGTQPTLEGDGTAAFLADRLAGLPVKVSRLARGIPVGASLQGVSKAVLMHAVQGRTGMQSL